MRTDITLVNLRTQRILETRESFINIEPDHVEFMLDFDSEVMINPDDEALGFREETSFYHAVIPKEKVATIDMTTISNPKRYVISIIVAGADDVKLYFKPSDKDRAERLRQQLVAWLLGRSL